MGLGRDLGQCSRHRLGAGRHERSQGRAARGRSGRGDTAGGHDTAPVHAVRAAWAHIGALAGQAVHLVHLANLSASFWTQCTVF